MAQAQCVTVAAMKYNCMENFKVKTLGLYVLN